MPSSTVRVGIIGYSEGNGHPYSFSAIINGYDKEKMESSPYPVIANYLSKRKPEEFGVGSFRVTHCWAPEKERADDIASCTYIEHVVPGYKEMAGSVDAVIIARDDTETHRELASYFLDKNIPTFIDKPLCDSLGDLVYFEPYLHNGLLMSCSGFRYYPGIVNRAGGLLKEDEILFSNSLSIIDWFRYGIHVLEGITPVMGSDVEWVQDTGEPGNHIVRIQYESGKYALIQVNDDVGFILQSNFYTTGKEHITLNYDDNFNCFRALLKAFCGQYESGDPAIDPGETITIIKTLIAANRSLNSGGKKIYLNDL